SVRRRHFAEKAWFFRSFGAVARLHGQQSIYLLSLGKCSGTHGTFTLLQALAWRQKSFLIRIAAFA
ncbi:hypothetical protein, partial [uncultured Desulfovibrio sp.]|uniref:hypothetical protein n=1 Tax=uncultured Desulfovibrio sp. TaxID=167968 RepID=UPI00266EA1C5